jgi:DNA-binding MarR family transcriptional regulator
MRSADPCVAALAEWIEVFMSRSMPGLLQYAKDNGLSMSQIGALFRLHKRASGIADLGDGLGVTSAAVSQMLDRLVQQELILRSEDPEDRRGKKIVITEKGDRILKECLNARQGWLNNLAKTLSADEKEHILRALKILINKANQLERPS